jgi:hypothetical protein
MKLLYVHGDDDYGVLNFESSELGSKTYSEVFKYVEGEHEGYYENEDEGFIVETYTFDNVKLTDDFILFLNDKKDYDVTKNEDWFIVEKE